MTKKKQTVHIKNTPLDSSIQLKLRSRPYTRTRLLTPQRTHPANLFMFLHNLWLETETTCNMTKGAVRITLVDSSAVAQLIIYTRRRRLNTLVV